MLMLGGVACTTNNLDGGNDLDGGNPDDNDTNELHSQIWYTATEKVTPSAPNVFGANIVSNEWNSLTLEGVITFDGEVTSIGDDAFYYCTSLESITIPNSVTEIGVRAFSNCTSLAEFNGKFASEDGRCLIIDGVLNSFAPYGLTEYTIPDGVTAIGKSAFYRCSSLASITMPNSVTSIGMTAFYQCSSLAEVYCKATTPPRGGYSMFGNNASGRKIYVPSGSVSAYKSASYWSNYADAIEGYDFE